MKDTIKLRKSNFLLVIYIILIVLESTYSQNINYSHSDYDYQRTLKNCKVEKITELRKEFKMVDSSIIIEHESISSIDTNGFCLKRISKDSNGQEYLSEYEYDDIGNIVNVILNGVLERKYIYNDSNKVTNEYFYKADTLIYWMKTEYDSIGNEIFKIKNYLSGEKDTVKIILYKYAFINNNYLYTEVHMLKDSCNYYFKYDRKGREILRLELLNNIDTISYTQTYYDDLRNVDSSIRYYSNPFASVENRDIEKWVTTLDSNGNRISLLIYNRNDSLTGYIFTQYDENGNRIIDSLHHDSNDDFIYAEFDTYNNQIELRYIANGELIFLYEKKYICDRLLTLDKYYNYKNNSITTKEYIYKFFE